MFTEEQDSSDLLTVALVALVVILLFAGIYLVRRQAPDSVARSAAMTAPAPTRPHVEVRDVPVKAVSSATIAIAYECWRDGQRILSDRPCGTGAFVREIAEPNRMDAQDTRRLYSPVAVPSRVKSGASSGGPLSGTSAVCDSIEAQIDAINARMRQPYTSSEGEHFSERLRGLSEQRYEARCIR